MPVSKATKKFEKNKLHDVLKKRKEGAKIKQRKQIEAKKKERKVKDNARAEPLEGDTNGKAETDGVKEVDIAHMSMDQFFQGGFQIPEMTKKPSAKSKTGKRKRTPIDDAAKSEDADHTGSESESGDDEEAYKAQLAELAEKDPDFYKYLKENDAELLDFAEEADLAEVDALSASEDETTPRKKHKPAQLSDDESEAEAANELTHKVVRKWKASMETQSSLRAMKEAVLAFRAAAHLNDDEGKKYKYSISDPDGTINCAYSALIQADITKSITRSS